MSTQAGGRDDAHGREAGTARGPSMAHWQLAALAVFFLVYATTVLATGQAEFLIPVVILAVLVFGYAMVNRALAQRIVRRDGSLGDAVSDEGDPIPSAHLIPDDTTPLGDTPEAHDEISPHDLPKSHPGRQAAEEQASDDGTTRGHEDPSQVN